MAPSRERFAVGVDLGTTNTVVAWAALDAADGAAGTRVFDIAQLVSAGEVASRPLFPSSLFLPVDAERGADPFGDAPWVLGEHARRRGAEVPGRLVASSKSWLAYPDIDRSAPVLPWGAADDLPKLSPVDAATRVLAHVRAVWDQRHPDAPLADQDLVLTVPASFDETARELTVSAAQLAGLSPKLLEEPQAAFYDWMTRAGRAGLARLLASTGAEALVLVVDVGGGTSDLSLVRVSGLDRAARVAVGPHLLLGGDNMDLALAHLCEPRLAETGAKLDATRFGQLVTACRAAKEVLLGASSAGGSGPPGEVPVTVLGSGAGLVGSTRTTRLSREETERVVLDGFFPLVGADARPQRARSALVAFGLPYERDVAITRHLAAFVARHLPAGELPNAVLLNGGVFRSEAVADRLEATLAGWRSGRAVERLPDADPDLAVARGAVAYALARRGKGVRIGGGSSRGYFVGTAGGQAVCVVPRGAEEGTPHAARGRTFGLVAGRPVRFDLYASDALEAAEGDVVDVDGERFARLPPLVARIDAAAEQSGERSIPGRELRVTLHGELTAVGTLDLACVEVEAAEPRRLRLAFALRERAPDAAAARTSRPPPAAEPAARRRLDAVHAVDRAFGKPRPDAGARDAKDLLRELERHLGERSQWTTETNRALFDVILAGARGRRRSADHERTFWLLAGWCVRPGFGDPLDADRVRELARLFDDRLAFPGEARGWQQFWIAWRRAAGGLDEAAQSGIRDFVDDHLAPPQAGRRRPKKPALSLDDALETASSLERVAPARRAELGGWVLERTWTERDPRLWAAIGRLGARVPAYASVHHVVAPTVAARWLDHLLREKWDSVPTAAQAATRIARRTGDRARDLDEALLREVEHRLVAAGVDEGWVRAVREVVPADARERAAFFGDALPIGLRLID